MGSTEPKVVARAGGRSLIEHVLCGAAQLRPERMIVVVGHRGELVREVVTRGAGPERYSLDGVHFVVQQQQLGTGDAAKAALPALAGFTGTVLILYGDVPLVRTESLAALLAVHEREKATVTILSLAGGTENAYGRVVRDGAGHIERVVELKDCTPEQVAITETNAGLYAVDSAFLRPALEGLTNENAQNEYYLTDIIERAHREGQRIAASLQHDVMEFQGVNTKADLAVVEQVLQARVTARPSTAPTAV